jgi:hypothetical protein
MAISTRTKLAQALRAYNQGLLDSSSYYHAVCAALSGE